MEIKDSDNLRRNRVSLANDLNGTEVMQILVGRKILSDNMVENILSKSTEFNRNVEFLNILRRRGPRAFEQFCLALQTTDQSHLLELLKPSRISTDNSNETRNIDIVNERATIIQHRRINLTVNDLYVQPSFDVYTMFSPPKRHALIVSVTEFDQSTQLHYRQGGDVDTASLHHILTQLGFQVTVLENRTAQDIWLTVQRFSALEDHKHCDSTMLFVMSHGISGAFFGSDGVTIQIDDIFNLFSNRNCKRLQNKPKGFFFQCCRGNAPDMGVDITDGKFQQDSNPYNDYSSNVANRGYISNPDFCNKLPSISDSLIAYATVDGYASVRNRREGSWFIQALVQVLALNACNKDLNEMMTIVNNLVSQREVYSPDSRYHRCKEMSEVQSTLRKKWYFFPGI